MAVSPGEGQLLNFLATISKAKHIVEFGCSYGISTLYLAAAARDNGGKVITTEIEPSKIAGAIANIRNAGLEHHVVLLQGDARQTLSATAGPIDFLFLDGAKELYLPVFSMLEDKLSERAIVFADNADHRGCRTYVDYISGAPDFSSIKLFNNRVLISYRN